MVRFCSKQVIAKRTAWALVFFSAYSAVFSDPEHLKRAVVVFFVGFSPSHHTFCQKKREFLNFWGVKGVEVPLRKDG